jgi:hypothetical protein
MFQLTGAKLPTVGLFRSISSVLAASTGATPLGNQISHFFMVDCYFTTKGITDLHQNQPKKLVALSRISVDSDVKV